MAVFNTNLIIHTGTDFEQTFILEDDRTNSAKDLTGYTGVAKFKQYPNAYSTGDDVFEFAFTNRTLGKIRIAMADTATAKLEPGKFFYDVLLNDGSSVESVIEGQVIVKRSVTRP